MVLNFKFEGEKCIFVLLVQAFQVSRDDLRLHTSKLPPEALKKSTFKGKLATRGVMIDKRDVKLGISPTYVVGEHLFIQRDKLALSLFE